ncbi:MAG: shikimate kinase AroK [Gammaproteobacteria bacterium]
MSRTRNIFLVGPMGAGKSTIGRQLAKVLQCPFVDSDREIERRTGVSIATIFDIEGEAGFRLRERKVIAALAELKGIVIATGGGAVLDEANRRAMRQNGFVVFVFAPIERLYARTRRDHGRPLLQTADPRERIAELFRQREPVYREIADLIINTEGRTVRRVANEIRAAWQKACRPSM